MLGKNRTIIMTTTLQLLATVIVLLSCCNQSSHACGDSVFDPKQDIVRDAYLLTEGETIQLTCGICGKCLPYRHPGCSARSRQLWMTPGDQEKAMIRERTKITKPKASPKTEANKKIKERWYRRFHRRMKEFKRKAKEKLDNAKKRIMRVMMKARRAMALAVQRFDRLKRLAMESENGLGLLKEIFNPDKEDSRLQWFIENTNGDMARVKHDSSGTRLLFDMLVISRVTAANTGTYTCRWDGQIHSQFGVTVLDGGVEPYREFNPQTGRSLLPKLLPKANLEVFTRWLGKTLYFLQPSNESIGATANSEVKALNVSLTWGICYVRQLDPDRPVMPEGNPALKLMPNGLPCRSHLLPLSVRSLQSVVLRPSEVRKTIWTRLVKENLLHFGLRAVNHTTSSPPPLSVDASVVTRSFMIAKQGEFVSLECPLKQRVRSLIVWFIKMNSSDTENKISIGDIVFGILNPFILREVTKGRKFTDPGGNLNIANVDRTSDQRKYFCIHDGRLVGYVNLIIRHAKQESKIMYFVSVFMNIMRVASPLVITASIILLTLITASSLFEPEVPW